MKKIKRSSILFSIFLIIVFIGFAGCGGGGGSGGSDDTDTGGSTAPDAPVITSPVDGATINISTLTISGTAEAGSTVELFDTNDTAPIGTAKADVNGDWSLTISQLADGVHNLTATATDAACNTSSPSTALIITVDTTVPGYADIPMLDCNTLLTINDIDEALAVWDRPAGEMDTVSLGKGEVCLTKIFTDERVFVQIEPGEPGDFEPGAELLGVPGEPVSGVGDDDRWFVGTGSAGGPAGVLSVREVVSLGVLYFRITVGRPDLNTDELLDLVKELALNALPRFPGVGEEPPRKIPPPEPVDTSSHGYAENLLEKEADGEWTRGEGLVATLRLFAGEVDPDEVLRHPDMIDLFGSDIIRMAQEYLESCRGDPVAKSEIERLLAVLWQQPTRSETEGTSSPFELDTIEQLMTLQGSDPPQLPEDCKPYWGSDDNCWAWWSIDPELHGEETYLLIGPKWTKDTGWTNKHLKMFDRAMTTTIDKFHELKIPPPKMDIILTPLPGFAIADADIKLFKEPGVCRVGLGTKMQTLAAVSEAIAEQATAAMIAMCSLSTEDFPEGTFAKDKWQYAGMAFFSDVVYPDAQLEHYLNYPKMNEGVETSKSMLDYNTGNWAFLEEVFSIPIVLELLKTPVNDIGDFPYIKDYIHEYAKQLTSGEIADMGSPHAYTPPTQKESLNNREKLTFDIRAYRPLRVEFSVDGGEYACVSFPPTKPTPQVSWSHGSVGSDLLWNQDLPGILDDKAVFIVTSKEDGKFEIKVLDFVEDPEDCQEVEDWEDTIDNCDIGICGATGYIQEN